MYKEGHRNLRLVFIIIIDIIIIIIGMCRFYNNNNNNNNNNDNSNLDIKVIGDSMSPTYKEGDILNISYNIDKELISNNDIIVFYRDGIKDTMYVKRVLATKGDLVEINNNVLSLNKTILNIDTLDEEIIREYIYDLTYTVNSGEVFVIGDNYNNSKDSRHYGSIPFSSIIGKVEE